MTKNKLLGMDNVLIVVDDLEAVKDFFLRLGLVAVNELGIRRIMLAVEDIDNMVADLV